MKKRLLSVLLLLTMVLGLLPFGASAAGFTDVKSSAYYYEPVQWAVGEGITYGTSSTAFSPSKACTRAQIVTFLWRFCGELEPSGTKNPFRDVKSGDYFFKAVLWAVEQGVTKGTGADTFSPNQGCTRAQVVSFLWRTAGEADPAGGSNPFKDVSANAYYYKAVLWAVEQNITKGTSDTTFGPNAVCDRAQIVTFLYRAKDVMGASDMHRVTFLVDADTPYQMSVVKDGAKAVQPKAPTRMYSVFTGWYLDAACTKAYSFADAVTKDLTLYAGWKSTDGKKHAVTDGNDTVYSVSDLTMDHGVLTATVNTNSKAILKVEFLDEKTQNVLTAVSVLTPDYAEMMQLTVPVDAALPAHYLIRGVLTDGNGRALHDPYLCIRYTSDFAAFEAKTTADFPKELVVNFDADPETNFGVLNENVKQLKRETGKNAISAAFVSEDSAAVASYTVKNPSAEALALKPGDTALITASDGSQVLFQVKSVTKQGDALVFVPATDADVTDFYTYMDVDLHFYPSGEPSAKPLLAILDKDVDSDPCKLIDKDLDETLGVFKITGHAKVTDLVHLVMKYDAHLLAKSEYEFRMVNELTVDLDGKIEAAGEKSSDSVIKFGPVVIPTPIAGLNVVISPSLPAEVSGKAGAEFTYHKACSYGFACTSSKGFELIKDNQEGDPHVKAEVEFEVKIGPKVKLSLNECGVIDAFVSAEAGLDVTGEGKRETDGSEPEDLHLCIVCVNGTISWYAAIDAGVSINTSDDPWEPIKTDKLPINFGGAVPFMGDKDGKYYFSAVNPESSLLKGKPTLAGGDCPNHKYRTVIKAVNAAGQEVTDVTITVKDSGGSIMGSGSTPQKLYLYNGTHQISGKVGDTPMVTQSVKVNGAGQTVTLSTAGSVEFVVDDTDTKKPVQGAKVTVKTADGKTVKSGATNEKGRLLLENIEHGSYTVAVEAEGYRTVNNALAIITPGGMSHAGISIQAIDYYKLYADIVAEREKTYGRGSHNAKQSPFVSGVAIVRLLDLNNDGIEELILGYSKIDSSVFYGATLGSELWTFDGDKAVKLYSGWPSSHGDISSYSIVFISKDGEWLFEDGEAHAGELNFHYFALRNHKLEQMHAITTSGSKYYVDGTSVSMTKAHETWNAWNKTAKVYTYYFSEDNSSRAQALLRETNTVRAKLGL